MAVAFDAVGPSSAGASSTSSTTLSWTHTNVGSGVALFVAIGVGINPDTGVSVTVNLDPAGANTTITSLGPLVHSNAGTSGFVALFGLPNTSSGAHTITATVTGGTPSSMEGGSLSYTGADTAAPFGAQVGATGNTGTSPVTVPTSSGSMVAGSAVCAASITGMSASTSRWITNVNTTTNAGNQGGGDNAAVGSLTTVTWTHATDWWGAAAVEVLAPTGPPPEGTQNSSGMNLMGKAYY
jgi:hypothetical protein